MPQKAFGHHLRAEKVFQTENMTENRTWKRKDLIFKPGSEFLLLQKHQEQDLSLALHCHNTSALVTMPFFCGVSQKRN